MENFSVGITTSVPPNGFLCLRNVWSAPCEKYSYTEMKSDPLAIGRMLRTAYHLLTKAFVIYIPKPCITETCLNTIRYAISWVRLRWSPALLSSTFFPRLSKSSRRLPTLDPCSSASLSPVDYPLWPHAISSVVLTNFSMVFNLWSWLMIKVSVFLSATYRISWYLMD